MLRKLEAVDLDGIVPSPLLPGADDNGTPEPVIEWGDPADLYVDDTYQRVVSAAGLALIKRVAKGKWNWRKYKLPVVTIGPEGRRITIDGQHTAIMALSRGVRRIPWVVVSTATVVDQADAFVGQNKDRTAISAMQQHIAQLASGDPDAVTIKQVIDRAEVGLVMWQPTSWEPGQTMALGSISTLVRRRFAVGAGKVLRVLRAADLAPILAEHIKAVECLMFDPAFRGTVKEEKLIELLRGASGARMLSEGAVFAATHRVQKWKGLTTVLYQARNRAIAA